MNSSVLFTVPVEETVTEQATCIQIELFWYCCNQPFRVIGRGDDKESALEDATEQFNDVMNFNLFN